jgi:hypothetical protein
MNENTDTETKLEPQGDLLDRSVRQSSTPKVDEFMQAECCDIEHVAVFARLLERENRRILNTIKCNRLEAAKRYSQHMQAYEDAEANAVNSFYDHNEASYWKGRRDGLRDVLSNVQDHESTC